MPEVKEGKVKKKGSVRPSEPVKVGREDFLHLLEKVQPGLSTREIVEQSSCFAFADGFVHTFNEEVACKTPTGLDKSAKGAVQADSLINILRKYPDDQVRIYFTKNTFVVTGKNRETGVAMENEILLPFKEVDEPTSWRKVHEDFTDAVGIVQECATKDQSAFIFTCIHVNPKFMEACDNLQLTRYKIKTGVEKAYLVRRDSLKHVASYDFTEMAETEKWVHFKSGDGMRMSCRRFHDKFEDLGHLLEDVGVPLTMPKALIKAADCCSVFSAENESDLVTFELRPGKMRITGQSAKGYHKEKKGIKYDGRPITFRVSPKLLMELLKRHTDCSISRKHRLIVDGGKFRYLACLEKV